MIIMIISIDVIKALINIMIDVIIVMAIITFIAILMIPIIINILIGEKKTKTAIIYSRDIEKLNMVKDEISMRVSEVMSTTAGDENCCRVCYDNCRYSLGTCGHKLCGSCQKHYCATCVQENNIPITCVVPECSKKLFVEDLIKMSSNLDSICNAAVNKYMLQNLAKFTHCHTPGCAQILDKNMDSVLCDVCLTIQCPKCGEEPHAGLTCDQKQERLLFLQSNEGQIEHHVSIITKEYSTPTCPGCKLSFVDFSNCFAVTCIQCRSNFCGFCLFNCGQNDAHSHSASCAWRIEHFGPSNLAVTFQQSMSKRLPEMAADYIKKIKSEDAKKLEDAENMRVSVYEKVIIDPAVQSNPFFDLNEFKNFFRH